MPYTEEQLEGLTDAEREGLLSTNEDDDDKKQGAADAGADADAQDGKDGADAGADAGDDPDAGAGDDGADADPSAAADAAASAAAEAAKADAGAAAEQPQKPAPSAQASAPLLVIQAPADADEKLAAIAARKEDIAQKFDDGEITAKEFQKAMDAENKAEREIERQVHSAELAQQMEDQRVQREWQADCDAFLVKFPQYSDEASPERQLLNETIMTLARMPSNAALTNEKALAKAHRIVVAELGESTTAEVIDKAAGKPVTQHKIVRAPAPPNIANLPQAAIAGTASGEFKHLERLQSTAPDAYEDALMKLTPAARDRWLKS